MELTREERAQVLNRYEASGLTVTEFCRREGLETRLLYHLRRANREKTRKEVGHFARVEGARRVELELPEGVTVRVAVEDLGAVLRELRQR